jgi:hypothetical protein
MALRGVLVDFRRAGCKAWIDVDSFMGDNSIFGPVCTLEAIPSPIGGSAYRGKLLVEDEEEFIALRALYGDLLSRWIDV